MALGLGVPHPHLSPDWAQSFSMVSQTKDKVCVICLVWHYPPAHQQPLNGACLRAQPRFLEPCFMVLSGLLLASCPAPAPALSWSTASTCEEAAHRLWKIHDQPAPKCNQVPGRTNFPALTLSGHWLTGSWRRCCANSVARKAAEAGAVRTEGTLLW